MSSTTSTAHRGYFCRASYLPRSDDKLGICTYKGIPAAANKRCLQREIRIVCPFAGIFAERCIYALLSTNGCFNLAEVKRKFSKEVREF